MKLQKRDSESGFTLIETIITIVIIAVVAVMLLSYFGPGIIHSADPIARLQTSARLTQVLEEITLNAQRPYWQAGYTYAAGAVVIPTLNSGQHGFQYTAQNSGTSGSTEPAWPLPPQGGSSTTVQDGGVTWELNTTNCAPTLSGTCPIVCTNAGYTCPPGLQSAIGAEGTTKSITFPDNSTVSYYVVENRFIYFNAANTEQCCDTVCGYSGNACGNQYGQYLKVTIRPSSGTITSQTLSTLFVER